MPRIQTVRGSASASRHDDLRIGKFANCEIFDTVKSCGEIRHRARLRRASHVWSNNLGGDTAAAKAMGQQRDLLAAVERDEPATLNQVAARVKRGAPGRQPRRRRPGPRRTGRPAARSRQSPAPALQADRRRPRAARSAAGRRQLAGRPHRQARAQRTARARARDRNPGAAAALGLAAPAPRFPALLGGSGTAADCGPTRHSCRPCPAC